MDLLPNIQVDLLQEDPEPLEEEIMSDEETPEPEPQEEIMPEVKERDIIPEENIFEQKKTKKQPPQKKEKKKRVMTEAQLERLRLGREKALAVRRAKALEKKEIKELQSKKKKKDIQKLREEVEDKPKPEPTPQRKSISIEDLPADMLVELQKRAIEGYDTKRKARKEQKKKEQQHQTTINNNLGMVNNALQPQRPPKYGEAGYFRDCF
tara:strand:- start:26 stop:652 length:627 start_codon:yes stop_codon:yes gene_type:complete